MISCSCRSAALMDVIVCVRVDMYVLGTSTSDLIMTLYSSNRDLWLLLSKKIMEVSTVRCWDCSKCKFVSVCLLLQWRLSREVSPCVFHCRV